MSKSSAIWSKVRILASEPRDGVECFVSRVHGVRHGAVMGAELDAFPNVAPRRLTQAGHAVDGIVYRMGRALAVEHSERLSIGHRVRDRHRIGEAPRAEADGAREVAERPPSARVFTIAAPAARTALVCHLPSSRGSERRQLGNAPIPLLEYRHKPNIGASSGDVKC